MSTRCTKCAITLNYAAVKEEMDLRLRSSYSDIQDGSAGTLLVRLCTRQSLFHIG